LFTCDAKSFLSKISNNNNQGKKEDLFSGQGAKYPTFPKTTLFNDVQVK
jgi:hypothetical protein